MRLRIMKHVLDLMKSITEYAKTEQQADCYSQHYQECAYHAYFPQA